MDDRIFAQALCEVCESSLLSREDIKLPKGFRFSRAFEERMREITGSRRIYVRKRLKLAFFAAAIFAVGFLLGMARQPHWGYRTEEADSGIYFTFDVSSVKDPKRRIEKHYTLAGVPDSLAPQEECFSTPYGRIVTWDSETEDGKSTIGVVLMQYIPAAYRDVFISENTATQIITDDNGIQYYIFEENNEMSGAIWYQDGYVFLVDAKMSKNELIELCKTLKCEDE